MNGQPSHVYAVIGHPVSHSRSPAMHNAALRALQMDGTYLAFDVDPAHLVVAVSGMRALGVDGFNVTVPHKEAMLGLVDEVERDARAIGAINTVLREGERWIGVNTDAPGLCRSLEESGVALRDISATVLGAGGAARAAVVGLARAGATRVHIAARRPERAVGLAKELAHACAPTDLSAQGMGEHLAATLRHTRLVVQATSATLGDGANAEAFAEGLPLEAVPDDAVITDMVYQPRITSVLRKAQARGLRTVDGLGMLLHQGVLAFERWTGERAPVDVMRAALGAAS